MPSNSGVAHSNRWAQLWLGVVCMILIANLQYAWTLFVNPMSQAHGWTKAAIQVAFSIFIATETWLTPVEGWLVDKLGPRRGPPAMIGFGGLLVGLSWVVNSYATSLETLYVGAALGGIGAGAVYATCVGNAVKWFPDRRGLAVGVTAAGFGAGAALTVIPIKLMIANAGYASAFFWFGLAQGVILLLVAPALRAPLAGEMPQTAPPKVQQSAVSFTPGQVLAQPVFWVLYVMFVLVSASGLMATAQIAPIAKDLGFNNSAVLFGASALAVALVIDNVANGAARPFFGWISDHIGREPTMTIAFGLGGAAFLLLAYAGHSAWTFVICAALIFFTWGEIFSLFPSTCTDLFGTTFATTNAMLLYTAKGTSAWLVPLANVLKTQTGGWHAVFLVSALTNFAVALAALFILRPIRQRLAARRGPSAIPAE